MKPKGRVLVLLCTVVGSLALPNGAAAKAVSFFPLGERYAEAHLAGTHGYRITILASNEGVFVMVRKGTASVTYFPFGSKLERDRIDARLPGVGLISLRFHQHNRNRSAVRSRKGVFVGFVKIRGERDYTTAESRHVRGEIVRECPGRCHRRAVARASAAAIESVSADTDRGRGTLSFTAFAFPFAPDEPVFVASLVRINREMGIFTSQGALSEDPGALEIATPPRSATVDPPAPFTGSATFQQESAKDFSWTGDLAVELPGIGEVSLAGPKFETELCRGRRCKGDDEEAKASALAGFTAAAPTPSPWRWPGSPR